jgi:hypothetical protein
VCFVSLCVQIIAAFLCAAVCLPAPFALFHVPQISQSSFSNSDSAAARAEFAAAMAGADGVYDDDDALAEPDVVVSSSRAAHDITMDPAPSHAAESVSASVEIAEAAPGDVDAAASAFVEHRPLTATMSFDFDDGSAKNAGAESAPADPVFSAAQAEVLQISHDDVSVAAADATGDSVVAESLGESALSDAPEVAPRDVSVAADIAAAADNGDGGATVVEVNSTNDVATVVEVNSTNDVAVAAAANSVVGDVDTLAIAPRLDAAGQRVAEESTPDADE